jgi:hypothetical protein
VNFGLSSDLLLREVVPRRADFCDNLYSGGFVCTDTLTWEADASGIRLEGEIGCKGNIVIDVFKLIALVEPGAGPRSETSSRK